MEARQMRNMALVLLGLLLVALVLEQPWSGGKKKTDELYPDFKAEEIDRIHVVNRADTVDLVLRDGLWLIGGPRPLPADTASINRALEAVDRFEKTQLVSKNAEKFTVFEVDSASAAHVQLYAGGGDPVVDMLLGKFTPEGGNYFRPSGEEFVYSSTDRVRALFARDARAWQDRKIFDVEPVDLTRLIVERGDSTIVFEKEADGSWLLKEPLSFPVRTEEMDNLLRNVAKLIANAYPDSAVTVAEAGLDKPRLRVRAERLDGTGIELLVGAQGGNGLYYAKAADRDWIYELAPYRIDPFYKDLLSMKAEAPPAPPAGEAPSGDAPAGGAPGTSG